MRQEETKVDLKREGEVQDKCGKGMRGAVGMLGKWEEFKVWQETKGGAHGEVKESSEEKEAVRSLRKEQRDNESLSERKDDVEE